MRPAWNPIRDMLEHQARLSRALGGAALPRWVATPGRRGHMPRLDLAETRDAFVIRLDLPGVRREDVELTIGEGELAIRGEVPASRGDAGARRHRAERLTGPFERLVRLPRDVDLDETRASMADGVLTVTVPKRSPARGRAVPIG